MVTTRSTWCSVSRSVGSIPDVQPARKPILTFLIGVAGHGLMVFAQKIIPIGTIGISRVAQPALALVWSFLLLGERLNEHQTIDIAIVLSGLLAFLVMNQRANRGFGGSFRLVSVGLTEEDGSSHGGRRSESVEARRAVASLSALV